MTDLPEFESATILRPQPGDVLVFCLESHAFLTVDQVKKCREDLQEEFPDNRVLVLAHGFDISLVRSKVLELAVPGPLTPSAFAEFREEWMRIVGPALDAIRHYTSMSQNAWSQHHPEMAKRTGALKEEPQKEEPQEDS
jgi:hypothetical protein